MVKFLILTLIFFTGNIVANQNLCLKAEFARYSYATQVEQDPKQMMLEILRYNDILSFTEMEKYADELLEYEGLSVEGSDGQEPELSDDVLNTLTSLYSSYQESNDIRAYIQLIQLSSDNKINPMSLISEYGFPPKSEHWSFLLTFNAYLKNEGQLPLFPPDENYRNSYAIGLRKELNSDMIADIKLSCLEEIEIYSKGEATSTTFRNIRFLLSILINQNESGQIADVVLNPEFVELHGHVIPILSQSKGKDGCNIPLQKLIEYANFYRINGDPQKNIMEINHVLQFLETRNEHKLIQEFILEVITDNPGIYYHFLDNFSDLIDIERLHPASHDFHKISKIKERMQHVINSLETSTLQ